MARLKRLLNPAVPLPALPQGDAVSVPSQSPLQTPAIDHTIDVSGLIAALSSDPSSAEQVYAAVANQLASEVDNLTRQRIEAVDPQWRQAIYNITIAVNSNCPETQIQARLSEALAAPDGVTARFLVRTIAASLPRAWDTPDRVRVAQALVRRAALLPLGDLYRSLQPPPAPATGPSFDPLDQDALGLPPLPLL
jgi:hypothetical protein